jgi:CBS domain-containing protein
VRLDQPIDEVMSVELLTISPGHSIEAAARGCWPGE